MLNCLLNSAEEESKKKVAKDKCAETDSCIISEGTSSTGGSNSTDVECVLVEKESAVEKAISSDYESNVSGNDGDD